MAPAAAIVRSIARTVSGAIALHSAYTGVTPPRRIAAAMRSAVSIAAPGGTIDRNTSAPRTNSTSSATTVIPALRARSPDQVPRPASDVLTSAPCARRCAPTPAPIAPGAMIATRTAAMVILPMFRRSL